MDKQISYLTKKFSDAVDDRSTWRHRVNSTLLLISVTLFSVVISLYGRPKGIECNPLAFWVYAVAIVSNALCVVLSGLTLYSQLILCNRAVRSSLKRLKQQAGVEKGGRSVPISEIKFPYIFVVFQHCAYILFLVMIVSYTVLAFVG